MSFCLQGYMKSMPSKYFNLLHFSISRSLPHWPVFLITAYLISVLAETQSSLSLTINMLKLFLAEFKTNFTRICYAPKIHSLSSTLSLFLFKPKCSTYIPRKVEKSLEECMSTAGKRECVMHIQGVWIDQFPWCRKFWGMISKSKEIF